MSNDPDQIREQIERTRADLSSNVNTLADTVNPAHAAKRQVSKVKDVAAPALGDAATDAAKHLKEPAQQATESVKDTAVEAAATIKDEGASAAHDVKEQAQDAADTVHHQRS